MRLPGFITAQLAAIVAALGALAIVTLQGRAFLWTSHAQVALTAIKGFDEALAQYRESHGRLPGDVNRDGEIDAAETAYVASHLARAGLVRGGAGEVAVEIAGRTVTFHAIARSASAVPNPPRGRNVMELRNLPCDVVLDLDARTDDGNLAKGNLRASVASCAAGGENDPVPVVAVALQR